VADLGGMTVYHSDLRFYKARQGEETYNECHSIIKCVPHPKFDGTPGFDIAICFFGKNKGGKNFNTHNYFDTDGTKADSDYR